jgi:1,4-alpha-glucan branching enzyme
VKLKSDPYARAFERRPASACCVTARSAHEWNDGAWMQARARSADWLSAPMSVYEMHLGSWMRHPDRSFYSYRELAERLVPYLVELGYTHVEFLPLMEHPLDESWGYQCTGFFAPSSRFGSADDLRFLIDSLHQAGIGVILDWVPGHFPADDWALAHYRRHALYEHEDPKQKMHPDWGTHVFNYGRNEVQQLPAVLGGLLAVRVPCRRAARRCRGLDDLSRLLAQAGEWTPNVHGGRENLEAIAFLREMNEMVHADFPGALTIAEESTAWPMVSRPTWLGGLGFSMKWNMGWMNDTLDYMAHDPVYRRYNHERLTFGQLYAYSENFVLPLSHDEVVHGKRSLLGKMPGDEWQRFANLRLLLAYQMTGAGQEAAVHGRRARPAVGMARGRGAAVALLQYPLHAGVKSLVRDLNRLYVGEAALHELDFSPAGFSVDRLPRRRPVGGELAAPRARRTPCRGGAELHAGAAPRLSPRRAAGAGLRRAAQHRLGALRRQRSGQRRPRQAEAKTWMGFPASLSLTLPPLAALVLLPA